MMHRMLSWRLNHEDRTLADSRVTCNGLVVERAPRR